MSSPSESYKGGASGRWLDTLKQSVLHLSTSGDFSDFSSDRPMEPE